MDLADIVAGSGSLPLDPQEPTRDEREGLVRGSEVKIIKLDVQFTAFENYHFTGITQDVSEHYPARLGHDAEAGFDDDPCIEYQPAQIVAIGCEAGAEGLELCMVLDLLVFADGQDSLPSLLTFVRAGTRRRIA
ncbi:MAG: hypothetical protein ACRYGI_12960 [Janthinobacterium lividum]